MFLWWYLTRRLRKKKRDMRILLRINNVINHNFELVNPSNALIFIQLVNNFPLDSQMKLRGTYETQREIVNGKGGDSSILDPRLIPIKSNRSCRSFTTFSSARQWEQTMDRPECNEEKGLDWRGSAPECCFNFAFLPSAWIKARAQPTEQTANISLRRRWKGSGKFYRARRRTANAASGLLSSSRFSPPPPPPRSCHSWYLTLSLDLSRVSFFSSFFATPFIGSVMRWYVRIAFGKREISLLITTIALFPATPPPRFADVDGR